MAELFLGVFAGAVAFFEVLMATDFVFDGLAFLAFVAAFFATGLAFAEEDFVTGALVPVGLAAGFAFVVDFLVFDIGMESINSMMKGIKWVGIFVVF